jgi:predicted Zn-dependent peptidase
MIGLRIHLARLAFGCASHFHTALLVLLLVAAPARAAELPIVRERLPNGLTVLIRENPAAPVVAVSVVTKMGARWETEQNAGISNYVHAVMVKGTAKRSGADLAEAVAGLGGKMSAYGDVDYSEIRASALSRFWRELLGLVAELALEPTLAASEVDRERDFLLTRIQRREDAPSSRAFDTFYAKLYGPHPYALPSLGLRESIRRIDHAAIVDWYRRFYRPERMVVSISGQAPGREILAEARRLFGSLPGGAATADATLRPPTPAPARTIIEQPAQQAQILVGGLGPAVADRDYAPVKVLATILGGGMAGRLFAELRDRQALAYSASAYFDPQREPGAFILHLGTAPDNVARAERALMQEVDRIRVERVGADELGRAKAYLLGSFVMDRRTNARQASSLAQFEVLGIGVEFPARYRAAVEAVTADDVLRVAKQYLTSLTTVVLRPPPSR